jgi:hypothetical protein
LRVTAAEIVRMLWVRAMNPSRFAWSFLALLVPLAAGCDPADEMPPPRAPQAQAGAAAQDEVPPPAPADPQSAPNDPNGMYASGEYTLGEDTDAYDDNDPAALTDFRQTLDPYGSWVDDPTYGTVWVPSPSAVGPDFVPYQTAGHWVYDDDYVWVSDYPWGWAPFHYGRWVLIDGRGWVWIPGRVYRGAWVAWGVDDGWGYVGWYPMAPPFVWFGGVAVGYSFYVGPRWVYCPRGEIFSPVVGTRVIAGPAAVSIGARVHPFVATPGVVGGPPPARLGYAAAQIPHASGTAAASLARAQQFARPSTAQPLGARPPARSALPGGATAGAATPGGHTAMTGPRWGTGAAGPRLPTGVQVPGQRRKLPQSSPVPTPHPTFRGGGHFGGGHGGGRR